MFLNSGKIKIIGTQKAALDNLYFFLKKNKKIKTSKYNINNFNEKEIKKNIKNLNTKNFLKLIKISKTHKLIIGSSSSKLEINIVNFLNEKKIKYYFYIDSITNISKRFKGLKKIPNNIVTINEIIAKEIQKKLKLKQEKKIFNLNMPYQNYLLKKYGEIIRTNTNYLYLTSFLGLNKEKQNINYLLKKFNFKNDKNKLYICIHPRENLDKWKTHFENNHKIKVFQNKNFFSFKSIKNVYGISTMGLVNFKFAGFCVKYFKKNISKDDLILKLYKRYNIKPV